MGKRRKWQPMLMRPKSKAKLPYTVQRSLLSGQFVKSGDELRMDLTIDPIDLPNGSMAAAVNCRTNPAARCGPLLCEQ
jgi:hypothetical protein